MLLAVLFLYMLNGVPDQMTWVLDTTTGVCECLGDARLATMSDVKVAFSEGFRLVYILRHMQTKQCQFGMEISLLGQ